MRYRLKRVNSLLLREMTNILHHRVSDPRIGFVTVTSVMTSPDLRTAKIFIGASGDKKKDAEIIEALHHARSYIQKELSEGVFLKYLPELKFFIDETELRAERIEQIIENLHKDDEHE